MSQKLTLPVLSALSVLLGGCLLGPESLLPAEEAATPFERLRYQFWNEGAPEQTLIRRGSDYVLEGDFAGTAFPHKDTWYPAAWAQTVFRLKAVGENLFLIQSPVSSSTMLYGVALFRPDESQIWIDFDVEDFGPAIGGICGSDVTIPPPQPNTVHLSGHWCIDDVEGLIAQAQRVFGATIIVPDGRMLPDPNVGFVDTVINVIAFDTLRVGVAAAAGAGEAGFAVAVMAAIGDELGLAVETVAMADDDPLHALLADRIDVAANVTISPDLGGPLRTAPVASFAPGTAVGFAVRSSDPGLVADINAAIARLEANGTLPGLRAAHGIEAPAPEVAVEAPPPAQAAGCFGFTPTGERLAVVAIHAGAALSTTTVAGQDALTSVARVTIQPGSTSVSLVLISRNAVIWQFSGAVDRLAQVVVASGTAAATPAGAPAAGVVGIFPPTELVFTPAEQCDRRISELYDEEPPAALAALAAEIGFAPDAYLGERVLVEAYAPTLRLAPDAPYDVFTTPPPPPQVGEKIPYLGWLLWEDFLRYRRAGIAEIDPSKVQAAAVAEPYIVLPESAGLVQLVAENVLLIASRSRLEFVITAPTRLPAGLTGSFRASFLLAAGVRYPLSNPSGSCIYDERNGEALPPPGRKDASPLCVGRTAPQRPGAAEVATATPRPEGESHRWTRRQRSSDGFLLRLVNFNPATQIFDFRISAGGGDDVVLLGQGRQFVEGGPDNDTIQGGADADGYGFGFGDGRDLIRDVEGPPYDSAPRSGGDMFIFALGVGIADVTFQRPAGTEDLAVLLSDGSKALILGQFERSGAAAIEWFIFQTRQGGIIRLAAEDLVLGP